MLDVLVNDNLKTICLTYPKGASSSIRTILMPQFKKRELGVNEFGEKWILNESVSDGEIHKHLANYPDYKIYAFCREPVERWATGLLFMMHTHWDLFYSDVSNVGQEIADNASDEYIRQLVLTMISINNNRCDFNDVHMHRPLFTLLQIKLLHSDVHLIPLSLMENILCDIHKVPRQKFERVNTSDDGYERGHGHHDNSKFIKKLHNRWRQIIVNAVHGHPDFVPVSNYLSIENKVYNQLVVDGHRAEYIFQGILDGPSCNLATGVFRGDMTSYPSFIDCLGDGDLRDKATTNAFHFNQSGVPAPTGGAYARNRNH